MCENESLRLDIIFRLKIKLLERILITEKSTKPDIFKVGLSPPKKFGNYLFNETAITFFIPMFLCIAKQLTDFYMRGALAWKRFKLMSNAFYFILKALFVLKMSKFLPWFFLHVWKRLDKKANVNFKIWDFTDCQISQEVKTIRQYKFVS